MSVSDTVVIMWCRAVLLDYKSSAYRSRHEAKSKIKERHVALYKVPSFSQNPGLLECLHVLNVAVNHSLSQCTLGLRKAMD